jgi:hypothetical protein
MWKYKNKKNLIWLIPDFHRQKKARLITEGLDL